MTANRGRLSTWLVESAVEPPAPVITLSNYIIQIEEYGDRSPTSTKARAWLDIKPRPQHKSILGQIYEETDHQIGVVSGAMEVDVSKNPSPVGADGAEEERGQRHRDAERR